MYVVHPILGTMSLDVLKCVAAGGCVRWGGVIRRAAGTPGAGQFVPGGFLKDLGGATMPAASQLLGLTQVAAAASVLNLGVSVIGFAVMAKKLGQLQRDMNALAERTLRNHDEVMGVLRDVSERLVELHAVALENQGLLMEVIEGIGRIRKDFVDMHLARVIARLEILQRTEGRLPRNELLDAAQILGEARGFAQAGIGPDSRGLLGWPDALLRYRLWCMAGAAEVQLHRRAGDLDAAAELGARLAATTRLTANEWRDAVTPADTFAGASRFAFTGFDNLVQSETRVRLRRLAGLHDRSLATTEEERGAILVAAHIDRDAGPAFLEAQASRARLLDFVEEVTERMESLADEAAFTARQRLSFDRWEGLPLPSSSSVGVIELGMTQ